MLLQVEFEERLCICHVICSSAIKTERPEIGLLRDSERLGLVRRFCEAVPPDKIQQVRSSMNVCMHKRSRLCVHNDEVRQRSKSGCGYGRLSLAHSRMSLVIGKHCCFFRSRPGWNSQGFSRFLKGCRRLCRRTASVPGCSLSIRKGDKSDYSSYDGSQKLWRPEQTNLSLFV